MRTSKLKIWNSMTPEERDYDRLVAGKIPQGASWTLETSEALNERNSRNDERELFGITDCSCHLHPPCSFCVEGARMEGTNEY